MKLSRFPRVHFCHLPTPLEPLQALSAHLGGPAIYMKRDDCTGLALGGNKARKLEFLVGEAVAQKATMLVSEGGLQSNHVRQTAAAAAKWGLKCELVLDSTVAHRDPAYEISGNLFLDRLLNATIHICETGETRADRLALVLTDARRRGERPYHIPVGGSTATGALGYVSAVQELLDQSRTMNLKIDHLVFASSSGGTHAGIIVGLKVVQSPVQAIGIEIDDDPVQVRNDVIRVADECAGSLGLSKMGNDAIVIETGYAAPGYGQPNPGMVEAVKLVARLEGILLDPVYTGKAMAGLIGLVREGRFSSDETVVCRP